MDLGSHFPSGSKGTILITTRNPDLRRLATVGSLEIGRLKLKDASKLLLKASKDADPGNKTSLDLANKIVETLGCLALAIVSAAALIRQNICSLEDYCAIFAQHRKRLLANNSSRLPSNQANDVYTTWNISREAIESRGTDDAVIALELLNIFSCLHFEGFTEQLFSSAWENYDAQLGEMWTKTLAALWLTAGVRGLHLFKGFGSQAWNPLPLREALNLIHSFSLISYNKDASGKMSGFFLHPLVHSWGRDRLSKAEFDQWSTRSLAILTLSSGIPHASSDKAGRQVLAHINACYRQSGEFLTLGDADMRTRMIAENFCWTKLHHHEHLEEACNMAEKILKLAEARWGRNDSFSLFALKCLGDQYLSTREYERAIGIFETIRDIAKDLPPEEQAEFSRSELLTRYAKCLDGMGYSEHAVRVQRSVVDTLMQARDPQNVNTIHIICSLIQLYHNACQYKEATKLGEGFFPSLKRFSGDHARMTLVTAMLLAEGYLKLDQRSKSLEMYEWLAETYLSFTSSVHPYDLHDLRCLNRVKEGFFHLGLREKSKSLAASLVGMSRDLLGEEDSNTQQWVRWLHFHECSSQVNAVLEDPTRPITSGLLDRLVATGMEVLLPYYPEPIPELADVVAAIRQKLQSKQGYSHGDREEIVDLLRDLERLFLDISCQSEALSRAESRGGTRLVETLLSQCFESKIAPKPDGSLALKIEKWLRY